jgi:HPt (histidine-containing phosphotransfer) domain-containing protein
MMDDLQARFLPRFTALAHTRLAKAREAASSRDFAAAAETARDLHAIAGEAGLLGLSAIVPVARESEECARRASASHADRDADALIVALEALGSVIESVHPLRSNDA